MLIPFDTLSTEKTGKYFLINDNAFSYAFSARYLLKKYGSFYPKNIFFGIAPVSFSPYLQLPDLQNSGIALKKSANLYHDSKVLIKSLTASLND